MRILPLLATLLLVPLAAGHGAPVVLDVEEHLIADEASETSYLWDGFDITDVYVREAHHKAASADGLVFRILASGIPMLASEHLLQIDSDLTGPIDLVSADGQSWSSSHELVEASVTTDESTQALNVNLQVFVPMQLNQTLGPVTALAFADGQLVDEAPGPLYVAGLPYTLDGEGTRMVDALVLDGPDGYTTSNITFADGHLQVVVKNHITVTGQHIFLLSDLQADAAKYTIGETTSDGFAASIEPGQGVTFDLDMDAQAPFRVRIQSDLGGQETFWVTPSGEVLDHEPSTTDVEPLEEESPGLGALALLGALGLALRRRL